MLTTEFFSLIVSCEPLIYIFGAFGLYGLSLAVQYLIFRKRI